MSSKEMIVFNSLLGHKTASKSTIEHQATEAALAGQSLSDACPYPFDSEAGLHFKAVYLLAVPAGALGGERGMTPEKCADLAAFRVESVEAESIIRARGQV